MAQQLRFIAALTIAFQLHACGGRDDPANGTVTDAGTSSSSSSTSDPAGSTSGATTAGTTQESSSSGGSSEGSGCTPADECRTNTDCPGAAPCVACACTGTDETSSGETGAPACPSSHTSLIPECDECEQSSCCDVLQACWGDGTETGETQCSLLDGCRVEQCVEVLLDELEACLDEKCPEYADAYEDLTAYFDCTDAHCGPVCSGN